MKKLIIAISTVRLIPHIILYYTYKNKATIHYDTKRWLQILNINESLGFVKLMTFYPEFRNLFYIRVKSFAYPISWLCPRMNTLCISTNDIGPGLFIQHGIATIIAAKSIGKDCWINQQVTIGFSNATDSPILGDNVTINAGAKIIGKVYMGNNSRAGANSVVVKDVPNDCTVVGVPAYIIKRNGVKVKEEL